MITKRKILIIDFDLIGNHIHAVFGVKNISKRRRAKLKKEEVRKKEKNFNELITKIDRNIDLISKANLIFDETCQETKTRIKEMLKEMQSKYDLIFIDTSSDTQYRTLTKHLAELSSQVICLLQGNLIYVRNAMKLLKEYEEEREKLKLVYNQKDENTLSSTIMKLIFLKYKIVGTLHYHRNYNKMINHNMKKREMNEEIRKDCVEIIKNCKW